MLRSSRAAEGDRGGGLEADGGRDEGTHVLSAEGQKSNSSRENYKEVIKGKCMISLLVIIRSQRQPGLRKRKGSCLRETQKKNSGVEAAQKGGNKMGRGGGGRGRGRSRIKEREK